MECKGAQMDKSRERRDRINRNIMECKGRFMKFLEESWMVLIETLWNVKNDVILKGRLTWICINRNIMECKAGVYGRPISGHLLY